MHFILRISFQKLIFLSSPTLLVFIVFGLLTSLTSSLYLFLLTYRCLLFLPLIFCGLFVAIVLDSGHSVPNTRTLYILSPIPLLISGSCFKEILTTFYTCFKARSVACMFAVCRSLLIILDIHGE